MLRVGASQQVELVTGNADFELSFARYGGWDDWITSVAAGNEYHNGVLVPRFNGVIVCPYPDVGKATASIVGKALGVGKPVYFYDGAPESRIQSVSGITRTEADNFVSGWRIY